MGRKAVFLEDDELLVVEVRKYPVLSGHVCLNSQYPALIFGSSTEKTRPNQKLHFFQMLTES